jgi:hypothetical protein
VNHLGFDPYALTIGEVLPMRFSARATLATSCVALLSTAACSDSTGPSTSTQSAARLAAHFDSLYVQANSLARGGSLWYAVRAGFLSDLERPLAVGAVPTDVTVTTATGVEHWKGVELLDVFSRGTFLDSGYALVAYRDPDAHTLLFATFGQWRFRGSRAAPHQRYAGRLSGSHHRRDGTDSARGRLRNSIRAPSESLGVVPRGG